MKQKNFISLSMALAFLCLSTTGILIYIKVKGHAVTITHTVFGLMFVGFAIFHILNNWSSIKGYSRERTTHKWNKELMIAGGISAVVLLGGITEFLEPIAEFGKIFAPKRERMEKLAFDIINTNKEVKGTHLKLMIEKGEHTDLPLIAAWVEDSSHHFVGNLFVPAKEAIMPADKEELKEGNFKMNDFRPESLPRWNSKTTSKTPLLNKETPHDNFVIYTQTEATGLFYIMMEVKSNNATEIYTATINGTPGTIAKLVSADNKMIKSASVEVMSEAIKDGKQEGKHNENR